MSRKYHKNQSTLLEQIFVFIFKSLWFLVSLPFRKLKFGFSQRGVLIEDKNYIAKKRLEIEKMMESQSSFELKHALFEADKLVDFKLKKEGFGGETFAERLKNRQKSLSHMEADEIWSAHKTRNLLAHESDANVSDSDLKSAIKKLLKYTMTYDS